MSILFGILFAFGHLSESNEITAMKANCMSYKTICMPIIILAVMASLFLIAFNCFISPMMQTKAKSILQEILMQSPFVSFSEKSVLKLDDYTFYVNRINKKTNVLEGVSIYKFDETPEEDTAAQAQTQVDESSAVIKETNKKKVDERNTTWRISASSATLKVYMTGIQMTLYGGFWQKANSKDLNNIIHLTFRKYTFFLPLAKELGVTNIALAEMSSPQILYEIERLKSEDEPYGKAAVEFWTRLLFATAPIAFVFMALPLGIMSGKGGKALGFAFTLAVVAAYYALLVISMNSAEKNYQYAGFIMWLPNVFMLGGGLFLFKRMTKK
jgi:lipopolysaccharide export LptBFGC system permease protein LptF